MDIYVLDSNFNKIGIIDTAVSVIFTQRYNELGDFELYVAASDEMVELLTASTYIQKAKDERLYIVQNMQITSDSENGNYITISGSDSAAVLGWRVIWNQANLSGTVENAIRQIVEQNAITTDAERVIPHLILGNSAGLQDTIRTQRTGQNVLESIQELCKTYNYGFQMRFSGGQLIFELYAGSERNVYFSPNFDNLLSSDYQFSDSNYANVARVAGEGEGNLRHIITAGNMTVSGMSRREIFVDARDVSSNEGEISATEYNQLLSARGLEKLAEQTIVENFNGEVSTENTYKLNEDYNLGDIVIIQNEYGMRATSRIIETIECEDENGHTFIPTFENWEVR